MLLLKIMIPVVIILGVLYAVVIYRKKCKAKRMRLAIAVFGSLPLELIPTVNEGFIRFLKEIHQVEIGRRTYKKQVEYILEFFNTLYRPEIQTYIRVPGDEELGSSMMILAAAAFLGELVHVNQLAEWKRNPEDPFLLPYLDVELSDRTLKPCKPFEMMLMVAAGGDPDDAFDTMLHFAPPERQKEEAKAWEGDTM